MIKSMTGYGIAKQVFQGLSITVELKSVNNRYLDSSVRIPRNYIFAEESIKSVVQSHISRGKVDIFISINSTQSDDAVVTVNTALLKEYARALKLIAETCDVPADLSAVVLSRYPDVLTVEAKEIEKDTVLEEILLVTEQALSDFDHMRSVEGARLCQDIREKLSHIEELLSVIEEKTPQTVINYRTRLEKKMQEVLSGTGIEESRILAEAAIYAEHIAVDEETVRLHSHISQLKDMLATGSPIGRKIDFLVQEFNREANTIGSKCQNSEVAHIVVDLKADIEKIREQIQNIE